MASLYVKYIVRAIMNFPGSHGYSIIKNLLALPIAFDFKKAFDKAPHHHVLEALRKLGVYDTTL